MSFTAKITADITKFEQNIDKAVDSTNRLEKTVSQKLTNMGDSFVNVGKKASILSAALVAAGGKAFMMAADLEDAIGATGQIFSDNADIVKGWAETLGTEYGIARKEALEYSNLMGTMLINIGKLTEEQAARQSAKLIELAGDLTAMYGGRTQDAVRALTGALKGNNTMLDNYGMAVNDALVKTRAFEMGLSDGTGELSLQARQAATLALIYEQTTAAQGQAAREADGASGSMRILRTEFQNLATELGEVLIPVITPFISQLGELTKQFRGLSPEMQSIIVGVAGVTAAVGPLLIVIGQVLKTLPLIKAAVVALTGPIGLVVAAITAATALIITHWDELKKTSKVATDSIVDDWNYMADHLKTVSASIGKVVRGDFAGWWEDVRTTFDNNIEYLRKKWEGLQKILGIWKGDSKAANAGMMAGALGGIAEAADSTTASVDNLTTSFKKLSEAQDSANNTITPAPEIIDVAVKQAEDVPLVIEPEIKMESFLTQMDVVKEKIAVSGEQISNILAGGIADFAGSIGDAFAGNWDGLGANLLSAVGKLAQQFGSLVIGMAVAALKLKEIIIGNPLAAIAAGAALVALGALASRAAQNMISSGTGGGGGYSSAPSMGNTSPGYGPSEYRGAYQDDFQVTFKIGTNELVGVLNTAEQRRNRI